MLSRTRQPLHHVLLARALFSTETTPSSLKDWTIQQHVTGDSSKMETLRNITVEENKNNRHNNGAASFSPRTPWHHLIAHQLQTTFLPAGYPRTVSPGYLQFVTWQALHHTAGAANGVLASTFLLYSVGLGAGAIPTAGAVSWILKDGLGQLGTLLFGRTMAHNFDLSSRTWYVAASGKLNIAMALEIATAVAPQWFLPLGATANAVKGLAWMAGGSSRSAFNVAFAADRNIADITAKATSQTICTSLIGTAIGMAIAASIEQSVGLAFGWYSALAAVHMYTAVESAKSVPLATLNPSRLKLLAEMVVSKFSKYSIVENPIGMGHRNDSSDRGLRSGESFLDSTSINSTNFKEESSFLSSRVVENLPSPAELAVHDGIFPYLSKLERIRRTEEGEQGKSNSIMNRIGRKSPLDLVVGTSLQKLATTDAPLLTTLLPLYKNKKYILVLDRHNKMYLVLHEEAETVDAVAAVLQATAWTKLRQQKRKETPAAKDTARFNGMPSDSILENSIMLEEALESISIAEKLAPSMVDALKLAGWDVQGVVIEPQRRRARW